jgi:catechol 2,3-dioxygenase-like lactoylglutathione lyase family enzyme
MADAPVTHPYFQVGVLVEDLEAAREELSNALGLEWSDIVVRENGPWTIRVCFAKQGPPYLELIEGPPGSPWEATHGSRIDHIGYWVDDLDASKKRLDDAGIALEHDGSAHGGVFTYHRGTKSGLRVELIDKSGQAPFYERWGLEPPAA